MPSRPPLPSSPLRSLTRAMHLAGAACLAGMALLTLADILGRQLFNKPIFGTVELVSFLAVLVVTLTLPKAHVERSHIGVELFMRHFPRRMRMVLRLVTDLACLALYAVVTWRMVAFGLAMRASGETSMNLGLPEYLVVFGLAFGFLVFALMILRDVLSLAFRTEE